MSQDEHALLAALSCMVVQYLEQDDGSLDHRNMSAGEMAIEVLSKFGFVIDQGRDSRWTEKGKLFLSQT